MPSTTRRLAVRGPFSLAASAQFLEGFVPAGHPGADDGHLHLAFPAAPSWEPIAVCVRDGASGVIVEIHGDAAPEVAAAHAARILSLDVDGREFTAVGDRDPVIGRLQQDRPGLRPVGFHSPYEAAAWSIISQRVRMTQAAGVRRRIAEQYGTMHRLHGRALAAFPAPSVLAEHAGSMPVPAVKQRRLRAVAHAALEGRLDADHLRELPPERALDELRTIEGIGPFGAELVLLRGAMTPDVLPTRERRLLDGIGRLYGLDDAGPGDLARIAAAWQPYRTWCCVLVRSWWEVAVAGRPAMQDA